jgi:Peptidase M15
MHCQSRRTRLRVTTAVCAGVALAAFALCTEPATARPSETGMQDAEAFPDYDARPRRRVTRHVTARRGVWRGREASRGLARIARRNARGPRTAIDATSRAAAPEPVPLHQRSFVAAHPLSPDAPAPAPMTADIAAQGAIAPRCMGAHRSAFALAVANFGHDFGSAEPALVEGAWPHCRGARHPHSNVQLASLGIKLPAPGPAGMPSLSGGSIHWVASPACLASPLRAILGQVASHFGPLTVNSTCRSPSHNRRVGGAPRSYHLTGSAVDFRVRGNYSGVLAFLARLRTVGGLKHYGAGVFHIDTGPRRTWGNRRVARYARR